MIENILWMREVLLHEIHGGMACYSGVVLAIVQLAA